MKSQTLLSKIQTGSISLSGIDPLAAAFRGMATGPANLCGGVWFTLNGKTLALGRTLDRTAHQGGHLRQPRGELHRLKKNKITLGGNLRIT